jgi:long-chain acyl-CoA synthetase
MTDLGIDSIYRVELLALIEEEYDVEIPEDSINQNTTVKDLEKLINTAAKVSTRQNFMIWPLRIGFLRSFFQQILFTAIRFFCKLEIIGKENLINIKKPVIFVANHNSHLDTPLILKALPFYLRRKMAVAAAEDYFFEGKFWLPVFAKIFLNAYPFSRTSAIRRNLKYSGWLMDQDYSILIYPEGTRSIDGKMGNFKIGIGMIAKEMDARVIPLRLKGTHEILPKGRSLPKRGKVQLIFSEPLFFSYLDSYISVAQRLEKTIKTLQ